MPIVMPQHAWKDTDHRPSADWPEDCLVQWGSGGIVLSRNGGEPRRTAFFEAFPEPSGFIRGEGSTIAEAERNAWEKYRRGSACDHLWSHAGYTNGGAICRKCRNFSVAMKPIVILGEYRTPLPATMLSLLATGHIRPDSREPARIRHVRRTWLKARQMGIELPDLPPPAAWSGLEEDEYTRSCRRAVRDWLIRRRAMAEAETGEAPTGLAGMFDTLSRGLLMDLLEQE